MKTTTDIYTGYPFEWDSTVKYMLVGGSIWVVPARSTAPTPTYLHPSRVLPDLLAELNNGKVWEEGKHGLW